MPRTTDTSPMRNALDRARALEEWAHDIALQLSGSDLGMTNDVTADHAVSLYLDSLALRSEWSV